MLWGWLVVAAALTLGWTACSSEENVIDEPTLAPAVSTIHVSVGAGMGDEAQTRSGVTEDVVDGKTLRTLKFTSGDRLYVWGVSKQDDEYRIMGYLTMKEGSLSTDGKSANFEGELTLYKKGSPTEDNPFTTSDPLSECILEAHLISETFVVGFFKDNPGSTCEYAYGKSLTTGKDCVNTLMTTALRVMSTTYDATTKTFTNFKGNPIFNCTIGGLKEGEYHVKMDFTDNEEDYNSVSLSYNDEDFFSSEGTVTVSDDGIARFAFSSYYLDSSCYYALGLTKGGDNLDYLIKLSDNGPKQLEYKKVYNVSFAIGKPLSEVTEDEIGWRVGSDGNAYPPTGKLPSDVKAEAMIAYFDSHGWGLAIALEDACGENAISWTNIGGYNYNKNAEEIVAAWAENHEVRDHSWFIPSAYEWQLIFQGCGGDYNGELASDKTFSYGNFRTLITTAGGTDVKGAGYWSCTKVETEKNWIYIFPNSMFAQQPINSAAFIRACFDF